MADDPFGDIGRKADDPFGDIGAPNAAQDFFKQLGSGLVTGVEAIPKFPAQVAGFVGGLVEKGVPGSEEARTRRQELLDLIKKQGGSEGIGQYLPQPETTAGQFGRTIGETIPAFVAGTRGPIVGASTARVLPAATPAAVTRGAGVSVPQAAVAGATAGVLGEAAGQATEGTEAEPYARIGATLAGGATALRAAEAAAARRAVPTIAQHEARAGQLYDQYRGSGVLYNPTVSSRFSQVIKQELQNRGLTDSPAVAGGTWGALTRGLEDTAAQTPQQFHTLYQELGHIARGSQNSGERLAANLAQENLLNFMERTPGWALTNTTGAPAQAVATLREANANWAAAQRAKNVSERIGKAQDKAGSTFSGLNLENQLRQKLGPIADPAEARRLGYTAQEANALQRFVRGTAGPNVLRYTGNILAGGGGIGVPVVGGALGGLGGGIGYLSGGDPLAATIAGAALPLAGLGVRFAGNRWALSRAQQIENMLRSRSPLAAQTMGTYTTPPAPFVGTALSAPLQLTVRPSDANTLATLGE